VPTICLIVGARPNFMKVAPVYRALRGAGQKLLLVHTGQHYDTQMSDVFVRETGLPEPDVVLGAGSGSHAEQTARALVEVERALDARRPALVVVPGDVNSTLAAALAAVKLGIPVAHLESGLRSHDWTMPEEHNRRLTDHLSSLLLATSRDAVANLEREGITDGVALVGNTMIDSVLGCLDAALVR
jgi:UDP-N-acetylglucosamine 2-epimerase (non-hydrolysing)